MACVCVCVWGGGRQLKRGLLGKCIRTSKKADISKIFLQIMCEFGGQGPGPGHRLSLTPSPCPLPCSGVSLRPHGQDIREGAVFSLVLPWARLGRCSHRCLGRPWFPPMDSLGLSFASSAPRHCRAYSTCWRQEVGRSDLGPWAGHQGQAHAQAAQNMTLKQHRCGPQTLG